MLSSDIGWSLNLPGPGISVMSTEGTIAYRGIVCIRLLLECVGFGCIVLGRGLFIELVSKNLILIVCSLV